MSFCYDAECEFCGEDVGSPEDARPFYVLGNVTFYPGGEELGVQIVKHVEDWQEPEDQALTSVHHECWNAYWGGTLAGKRFYEKDIEN